MTNKLKLDILYNLGGGGSGLGRFQKYKSILCFITLYFRKQDQPVRVLGGN